MGAFLQTSLKLAFGATFFVIPVTGYSDGSQPSDSRWAKALIDKTVREWPSSSSGVKGKVRAGLTRRINHAFQGMPQGISCPDGYQFKIKVVPDPAVDCSAPPHTMAHVVEKVSFTPDGISMTFSIHTDDNDQCKENSGGALRSLLRREREARGRWVEKWNAGQFNTDQDALAALENEVVPLWRRHGENAPYTSRDIKDRHPALIEEMREKQFFSSQLLSPDRNFLCIPN